MNNKNKGKQLFDALGFQYKPLERQFINFLIENKQNEIIRKYKKLNYIKKIQILDNYASFLGL
jgi:hypothetical protein